MRGEAYLMIFNCKRFGYRCLFRIELKGYVLKMAEVHRAPASSADSG